MEDEIRVGEYVRSWNGSIGKVTRIEENRFLYDNKELICFIGSVVKHSFDIIDLVQKGDYVNGCKVYRVEENTITVYQEVEGQPVDYNYIMADEIKTIVTKEQIKQIEFRIKE